MRYKLEDDNWLRGLYEERDMWIPAYVKHLFLAGMKTTQRVESMNCFFDGYVDKHTRLYEFVERYIEAMKARADSEKDADDNCSRYVRQTLSDIPQEKNFQRLYTDGKFKEVQSECARLIYLNCDKKQISETYWEHVIQDRVWVRVGNSRKETPVRRKIWYKVTFDSARKEVECECKHFECTGIMCRHMLKVYDLHDVVHVPEKYILRRWRKDIPRKHTRVKVAYHDPTKTEVVRRYDRLMETADPISAKASVYKEATSLVIEALQLLDLQVDEKIEMIEKKKSEEQRMSKIGMPNSGRNRQYGKDMTPPSVTQKRKLVLDNSVTDVERSLNAEQSGVGSTANVLDPVIPPKKAHRTTENWLKSSAELSMKEQACKLRREEAERKRAEKERVRVQKLEAAERRRIESERRKFEKQLAADLKKAEKEKAIQLKKEARERAAAEKKLERERANALKELQKCKGKSRNQPPSVSEQQKMIIECEHQTRTTPLVFQKEGNVGVDASSCMSTSGIQMIDFTGGIRYFTTAPSVLQGSLTAAGPLSHAIPSACANFFLVISIQQQSDTQGGESRCSGQGVQEHCDKIV